MPSTVPDEQRKLEPPRMLGRYALYEEIAAGGMASVHLGRLLGQGGFSRTVAIKRLHAQFAKDAEFRAMFLDEARLAARVRHPNALPALDVLEEQGELYIVMDYVHGEALAKLLRLGPAPLEVVSAVMSQALLGLHAAHEALDEAGAPLRIVHRDVSPQNILVGVDGVARVVDFGVAKASYRIHTTDAGRVKGKLAYMSPEQLGGREVDRRTDIFAAGVVLWEASTGHKLLARGEATIPRVMNWQGLSDDEALMAPEPLRPILRRALAREPGERYETAREMAGALTAVAPALSAPQLGEWVEAQARSVLVQRARVVQEIEKGLTESEVRRRPAPQATTVVAPPAWLKSDRDWRVGKPALLVGLVGALAAAFALISSWSRPSPEPAPAALSFSVHTVPAPKEEARPIASSLPVVELEQLPVAPPSNSEAPRSKSRPRPVSARVPAPAVKKDCDPPYTLGPNGVKRFKSQCLK